MAAPTEPAGESVGCGAGRVTASALQLREGLPLDEWIPLGREISRLSSSSAWWLGDWLIYGEQTFRGRYGVAVERSGLDYQTLRNYAWVARKVAVSRRRDTLSFQHHVEVAALPEAEQGLWLNRAERLRWSRNELRRQLAAWRSAARQSDGARPEVVSLRVSSERERRWHKAADAAGRSRCDWIAAAADDAATAALDDPAEAERGSAQTERGGRRRRG